MYISDYIQGIVDSMTFDHDYIEAFIDENEEEVNLKLEYVTKPIVIAFLNVGTYVNNITVPYRIASQDYNIVFRIFEQQAELDDSDTTLDTDILTALEVKANKLIYAILNSAAYKGVADQARNQTVTMTAFKREYDNITAGLQIVLPVKLWLNVPLCDA